MELNRLASDVDTALARHRMLALAGVAVRAIAPEVDDLPDELTEALIAALDELSAEGDDERSYNPNQPRNPKGASGAGRWRSMVDRIKDALTAHSASGGKGSPLAAFNRRQLLTAAKARGLTFPRGTSDDDIKKALLADLTGKSAPTPSTPKAPTPSALPAGLSLTPRPGGGDLIDLNGTFIGHVEDSGNKRVGWLAHDSMGHPINLGSGFHSHDDAVLAVHSFHQANPPVQLAPGITLHPWPYSFSSSPGAQSFTVTHNGVNVGDMHSGGSKGWTAFPPQGATWGLGAAVGSGSGPHTTQSAAAKALVRAHAGANPASTAAVPVSRRVAGIPGVTATPIPAKQGMFGPAKQSHRIDLNGVTIGEIHQQSYGWTAETAVGNPVGTGRSASKTAAIQALIARHTAPAVTPAALSSGIFGPSSGGSSGPSASSIMSPSAPTGPAQVTLQSVSPIMQGSVKSYTVRLGGVDIGDVDQDGSGRWRASAPANVSSSYPLGSVSKKTFSSRQDAVDALVNAHNVGNPPAPKPTGRLGGPEVKAALDVVYGVDPQSTAAGHQLKVYGDLRRAHFDSLDPAEQSVVLGDLSHIATTAKGTNATQAQKLFDRFTPPGTPLGTIPGQAVIPPAGHGFAHQSRVADPAGTPGLLTLPKPGGGGAKGDGWTRTASGGSGPWGQYGAAGLMLRHVDGTGTERFLMIERGPGISDPGKWQFPGGAKDEKESFYEGATRETVEELGFKPADLDTARVHGTHTVEDSRVMVPALQGGGKVPWAYVSIAATVPHQITPDLSTHHAQAETSDAKWMTRAEIAKLDQQGKLLTPLASGKIDQNVLSLFPPTATKVGKPGRPARLAGPVPTVPTTAHKVSRATDLIHDQAAVAKLQQDVAALAPSYANKVAGTRLAAIAHLQGFDETPTVVSRSEIDRLLATGDYVEVWRGTQGKGGSGRGRTALGGAVSATKTAAQMQEEMRSGPAYFGTGMFGHGYYFATDKSVAKGYTDGTPGSLARALIPKSAKTQTHDSVEQAAHGQYGALASRTDRLLYDEGRYAAAKGIDAVEIPHNWRTSHVAPHQTKPAFLVLNRSILIVEEA